MAFRVVTLLLLSTLGLAASEQNCGKRFFQQDKSWIVGGDSAVAGAYPWQVSLQTHSWLFGDDHVCGATIISENWIASAAHCFGGYPHPTPSSYRVVVGEHDTSKSSDHRVKYELEAIIVHPNYDSNMGRNDVVLLKVKKTIKMNKFVQPACLPDPKNLKSDYKTGTPGEISGWGEMSAKRPDAMWPGRSPSVMHAAVAPLMDPLLCSSAAMYGAEFDPQTMICAGRREGGVDSCQGDSGGPLVANRNGKMTLLGITSWGAGCAQPNLPGVYTFVAKYVPWIRKMTGMGA